MTEVKFYIADDGKRFDTAWECEDYEQELRSNQFKDSALLFDNIGKKLPLSDASMEERAFIICKTDEAAKFLFSEFPGWQMPWDRKQEARAGAWILWGDIWEDMKDFIEFAEIGKRLMEEN